jgi:hypothetical protein
MDDCPRVLVTVEAFALVVEPENAPAILVATGEQGPAGRSGLGAISADAGNAITQGTDSGLYAPDDIPADLLAYYILAKG